MICKKGDFYSLKQGFVADFWIRDLWNMESLPLVIKINTSNNNEHTDNENDKNNRDNDNNNNYKSDNIYDNNNGNDHDTTNVNNDNKNNHGSKGLAGKKRKYCAILQG